MKSINVIYSVTVYCTFSVRPQKRLLVSSCLSVRLSVSMVQTAFHWLDFREVLHCGIFH